EPELILDPGFNVLGGTPELPVSQLNFLNFIASLPTQNPDIRKTPCADLAANAQRLADKALKESNGDEAKALEAVDHALSQLYLGNNGIGRSITDAITFFRKDIQPQTYDLYGYQDFKPQYQDTLVPNSDQTHHFVAYFSAGINGQAFVAMLHEQFTDRNNPGDRRLGNMAFAIGFYLKDHPSDLRNIGEEIKKRICN